MSTPENDVDTDRCQVCNSPISAAESLATGMGRVCRKAHRARRFVLTTDEGAHA